ncbi:hypothetical protein BU24DRAFT_58972 [Aaosphaeria arxii CBS 175.79]|uniref:Uncharacterized protein n=1 Tax=Aaosphaeria arxii CBS 175.79 TaxID=1450172 RepID=A0A6A5XBW5_9PLEO|nr:uncharacterized protein BU24DRAFT_58972 [Aaosphaeria arxii CBS 175.79]KAF2010472.1 hypothetical protein BU24DRAFT_58972 [Aaosphaeria arxii CBS 175.79]
MDHLPLPPSTGTFTPSTPSCLTPNTRSEAEAQLTLNTASQTDSAAPTTPLPYRSNPFTTSTTTMATPNPPPNMSEAQSAYHDAASTAATSQSPTTSSSNYEAALLHHHSQHRKQSTTSTASTTSSTYSPSSPISSFTTRPFPEPGQGVVPLHTGVNAQTEQQQQQQLKRTRPAGGLSLGELGRKQSWSAQDMRHEVYEGRLLAPADAGGVQDAGYSSGTEGRAVGP